MLLGFKDVDNQQKPDSLTDEEGCKSVTSYVLAHKDARIRGQGRLLSYNCILRAFNFRGERNLGNFEHFFLLCLCVLQKLGNTLDWCSKFMCCLAEH